MFAGLLNRATVKVVLQEDHVYVQPNTFSPDSPALGKDPLLNGTVLLNLPAPRDVSKLKVVLEGRAEVQAVAGQPYESTVTLHKELEIEIGETLAVGSHSFQFTFLVPSNTPGHQRLRFGSTKHFVRASASFAGSLTPTIKSEEALFFVIAGASGPGDGFLPTDLSLQVFSEDLGPVGIGFSSPHLTVASLLSCRVTLLATPPGRRITVVSIRGIVTQRHEVHYKKSGKVICPDDKRCVLRIVDMSVPPSPTPSRSSSYKSQEDASHRALTMSNLYDGKSFDDRPNRLFASDPKPLAEVGPSEVFHHARILRVPDGLFLRPSTPAGSSEEPIVVKHLLSSEIRYLVEGETEEKILTISKDIDLGHCSELADTFLLPIYTEPTASNSLAGHTGASLCNCMLPLRDMIERDRAAFKRAHAPSPSQSAEAIERARVKTPSSFHEGP